MTITDQSKGFSRRSLLKSLGLVAAGYAVSPAQAAASAQAWQALPTYTGPEANPYWNSIGPLVQYPEKVPLIRLTDRPVQLETPRHYFRTALTPNEAFFVRYHLPGEPNRVDLAKWRLQVEGQVNSNLSLNFADLLQLPAVEVVAVNQCSVNSRSDFQPRVSGGQWGHGGMGCARWRGVRLRDLLDKAGIKSRAKQVQFQGLDFGKGPKGYGSHAFMKSFDVDDPVLDRAIVAYSMNDAPLPILNGFPARLIFPGKFATYWVKHITWIRILDHEDSNFWTAKAYKIPNTPNADTTPAAVAAGQVNMVPIGTAEMPVRSFIVAPDGATKLAAGFPISISGIAFTGQGGIKRVEVSTDDGKNWHEAKLGEDLGPYAFRTWAFAWTPRQAGRYILAVRATDGKGMVQPDHSIWNPGGYLLNRIERQSVVVGAAS